MFIRAPRCGDAVCSGICLYILPYYVVNWESARGATSVGRARGNFWLVA